MRFSIVTPSYNMLPYLKLCHGSVMDQRGADVEHIVIDGGSTDGTVEWLQQQRDLIYVIEADEGMYDAINKGICLASADLVAYLNCDEQYLPGALSLVSECFRAQPEADVVYGDTIVIDQSGEFIAYRKAYTPRRSYIQASYLYILYHARPSSDALCSMMDIAMTPTSELSLMPIS